MGIVDWIWVRGCCGRGRGWYGSLVRGGGRGQGRDGDDVEGEIGREAGVGVLSDL